MRLVGDDREVAFLERGVFLDLIQDEGKRLDRHDDDRLALEESLREFLGLRAIAFLAVDAAHHALAMLELIDRVLKLVVQHGAVGDDENRVKYLVALFIVERGELMRDPCDGIRFPRPGGVLRQILMARTFIEGGGNQ